MYVYMSICMYIWMYEFIEEIEELCCGLYVVVHSSCKEVYIAQVYIAQV